MAALSSESRGQVAALTALQQYHRNQEKADNYVHYRDQNGHDNKTPIGPEPASKSHFIRSGESYDAAECGTSFDLLVWHPIAAKVKRLHGPSIPDSSGTQNWCGRGDLNPHAFRRHPLKMVCLPVPPLPLYGRCFANRLRETEGLLGTCRRLLIVPQRQQKPWAKHSTRPDASSVFIHAQTRRFKFGGRPTATHTFTHLRAVHDLFIVRCVVNSVSL